MCYTCSLLEGASLGTVSAHQKAMLLNLGSVALISRELVGDQLILCNAGQRPPDQASMNLQSPAGPGQGGVKKEKIARGIGRPFFSLLLRLEVLERRSPS